MFCGVKLFHGPMVVVGIVIAGVDVARIESIDSDANLLDRSSHRVVKSSSRSLRPGMSSATGNGAQTEASLTTTWMRRESFAVFTRILPQP